MTQHIASHRSGKIHEIPPLRAGQRAECTRCGSLFSPVGCRRTTSIRPAAAAVAALVLFWPEILCPILEIEKMGIRQQSSLLGGTIDVCR